MTDSVSILQAIAALLIVLGLIALCAWAVRRFAFGGQLLKMMGANTAPQQKQLAVMESLWLDARHRVVVVRDGTQQHTLLLGPNSALQLGENKERLPHA